MLKHTRLLLLFFMTGGCEQGPYNSIVVETSWGHETISSSCYAWTDGCNTDCRTNNTTDYKRIQVKEDCKNTDIHRAQCIDDDPEKLKICD